ncbi:MAG TPA: adenylate kinase [Chitinophagales bacterium]|jgi:adenylate kinase|nr:adenylate kinase [Chitinophagales bacterium]HPA36302.1 adenylate kinase [Chitinophagales bacterium]HPW86329.1 adenylate kinase [Chitinophagales bacterium]HQD11638.1 adenylate kinase [Chitinophagales bacterium]HQO31941.1 adenylate kinase [Chitinophagales bacterium]
MINLILFGPPGSGKGTQAVKLAEEFNLLHISTGDLFRSELKNETPLGLEAKKYMDKGELVPDEVTIGMLSNKLDEFAGKVDGFIFDGFPRTQPQAEALDKLLDLKNTGITVVLALEVPEDEIVSRIKERGKSSGRADDLDDSIIRNRFKVYLKETAQVADHYKKSDKFVALDGVGSIEAIAEALKNAVNEYK